MNKQDKQMFRDAPKWLRKQLTDMRKGGRKFLVMSHTVGRPDYVTQTDGKRVAYVGP